MRRFLDHNGREWEAVVGRGSWGVYLLLFAPVDGGEEVREAPLQATSFDEAMHELDSLDDADLAAILERATAKQL